MRIRRLRADRLGEEVRTARRAELTLIKPAACA